MAEFVDEAQLHAKGGDGGAGAVSFRREAHVAKGGPDGGDGGRGGDVWLVASANQASLLAFRDHPHRRAADGAHGSGKRKHGARGADLVVPVPVGTVAHDRDGSVLCDLASPGDRWLAARGGRGGWGNARFLTNRRRAPAFAEQGERGEERWVGLELKLTADVALVGFPNVGKSTLISSISAARPRIADYPFTTLEPHLGVVRVGRRPSHPDTEVTELVVADVPGLVEGAAEGKGLGHRFLRHVERARVLLVLLDLSPAAERPPAEQLRILLGELGRYSPELLERPRLVVGSRADLAVGSPAGDGAASEPVPSRGAPASGGNPGSWPGEGEPGKGEPVGGEPGEGEPGGRAPLEDRVPPEMELRVSSVTGLGMQQLVGRLAVLVAGARAAEAPVGRAAVVVHRPVPEGIEGVAVERAGPGCWAVTGRTAERAVGLSDMTDEGAVAEAVRRLRRLGVDRALARAGARDGDEVRAGAVSFTWYRDSAADDAEVRAELEAVGRDERPSRTRRRKGAAGTGRGRRR